MPAGFVVKTTTDPIGEAPGKRSVETFAHMFIDCCAQPLNLWWSVALGVSCRHD